MIQHRKLDFRNLHYAGEEGMLIPALQKAQEAEGYISREKILEIHRKSGVPVPQIYGVATFYAQFRLHPVGRHIIKVCHGTACHVAAAKGITEAMESALDVKTGETTKDRLFTLETVSCLGCCSLAPVVMIGTETYGNLDPAAARKIIRQKQKAASGAPGPKAVKP
jgi:NADH-quinone oxidoreductase subunit E